MLNKNKIVQARTVIHCKTETEARLLCTYLHSIGLRWCSKNSYLTKTNYESYWEDTCYYPYMGEYANLDYYVQNQYIIIPFSNLLPKLKEL